MKRLLNATAVVVASSLLLAGCGGGSDDEMETPPVVDDTAAMEAKEANDAINMANNAAAALNDMSDADAIAEVEGLIATAMGEIADLPAADRAAATARLQPARTEVMQHRQRLTNAATNDNKARMKTARMLYAGIGAPSPDATTDTSATRRHAAYNTDDNAIVVTSGVGTAADIAATLSEDKETMVAALHGWKGKRYADPAGGDSYEAIVYSNIEDPKMGKKFGSAANPATATSYQYQLADGELSAATINAMPRNVVFTGVTRTAGTETFHLRSPNPTLETRIPVPGSYHGVSGTYYCNPTTDSAGCSASVDSEGGFMLDTDTGAWTFRPSNAEARVLDSADDAYASYGWWIKKSEGDLAYSASAFVDQKGDVPVAAGLDDLSGMAKYVGGAAGKYALYSTTGGTNDAGHFTAAATLDADFNANMIEGTIDTFMGADGQRREWSVKLKKFPIITGTGVIGDSSVSDGTTWTIDGTAADGAGWWSGTLRNDGDDNVPQVATGTFYSEYDSAGHSAGKMVGAFGANKGEAN